MCPSSSVSIFTPVASIILLIVFPPAPITSLTFSGSISIEKILGAYFDKSSLGLSIADVITSRILSLALWASAKASSKTSLFIPEIFISIWRAVIPSFVPATLKSISPRWSSSPWMSVRIEIEFSSLIKPIAIPATGFLIGTPASISDKVEPQIDACDDEPFDDKTSLTTLIV